MSDVKLYLVFLGIAILMCGCEENGFKEAAWSLTYPNGPESLVMGTNCHILWHGPSSNSVRIELYRNSEYFATIADETFKGGSYEWSIPINLPAGQGYSIMISDTGSSKQQISGKNSFRLLSPGIISTFTDSRDGQEYLTVKLGEQVWMAENFNYRPEDGWYCYEEDPAYCETLGKLYTQEAAISNQPEGWHLPSDKEWKILEAYLGMASEEIELFDQRGHSVAFILRPEGGSGFNAIFGGYYNGCVDGYGHHSYESHYWSSSQTEEVKPILRVIGRGGTISRLASTCHMGSSVRYIKDSP